MESLLVSNSILESDRSMVAILVTGSNLSLNEEYTIGSLDPLFMTSNFVVSVSGNLSVMLLGLYILILVNNTNFLQKLESMAKYKRILLWSTIITFSVINITFFVCDIFFVVLHKEYSNFLLPSYFPTYICLVIETCFVTLHSKRIKRCTHITKPCFTRTIIFSITFWSAHRLWNWFFISIYFIATDPAPALIIIFLLFGTIVIVMAAIATISHLCCYNNSKKRKCTKQVLMAFLLFFIVFSLIVVLVFFTIIFLILISYGLSLTEVGTILLSLTISFVLFLTSVFVKRYLKQVQLSSKDFSSTSSHGNVKSSHQELKESTPLL